MAGAEFSRTLDRLAQGQELSREETALAMNVIMTGGATDAQIGAFLMALRVRGETSEEIAGAADSMRAHAVRIHSDRRPLIDTCGTGGDGVGTFNISTASGFVVAGAGVAVAKHGNRSVSSRCGSADVLEAMGAKLDLPPGGVEACLETTGIGFLFAPHHHGAMRHAAGVRKDLAIRTLFNLLGPLCNPANVTHQLMGVYDGALTETVARVLSLLGCEGAMVVHGDGGLDEISLSGPTRVSEWRDDTLKTFEISPEGLGLTPAPLSEIQGGDAEENASVIRGVLENRPGPALEIVCANAGAALYVAGSAPDLAGGVVLAREAIADGRASKVLDAFCRFTREWGN